MTVTRGLRASKIPKYLWTSYVNGSLRHHCPHDGPHVPQVVVVHEAEHLLEAGLVGEAVRVVVADGVDPHRVAIAAVFPVVFENLAVPRLRLGPAGHPHRGTRVLGDGAALPRARSANNDDAFGSLWFSRFLFPKISIFPVAIAAPCDLPEQVGPLDGGGSCRPRIFTRHINPLLCLQSDPISQPFDNRITIIFTIKFALPGSLP